MLFVALLLAQEVVTLDGAIANYREKTRAETPCRKASGDNEIVVCARRQADRYRLPLMSTYNGAEAAEVRIARLTDTAPPPCGEGAFLVKCGMAGVTATVSSRGVRIVQRPLAP